MSEADITDLLQIAKVLKSNGTEGGLLLGFRDIAPEDIDLEEPVFIYFDGLPVPFFIESFARKGTNKAVVKLTDIDSLEDAEEVVGQGVWVEESTLPEEDDEEGFDLSDLLGWKVFDNDDYVGDVTGFEDIPGNPCLYIAAASGEALVPLHEDLILNIDSEKAELHLDLPEGLI